MAVTSAASGRAGDDRTARIATGPLVFLDKDGTLIEDLPYNVDPRRIRFAPGAREAVRLLGRANACLVVATNQSGIARGYFTADDLAAVARHLGREFEGLGARLAAFYFCPHGDEDGCGCRKPEPGLVRRACRELGLSPRGAWFVGDTWMDVEAGRAAGCRTILVGRDPRALAGLPAQGRPDHRCDDLLSAARLILAEASAVTSRTEADA